MKRREKAALKEKSPGELLTVLARCQKELVKLRMETRLKKVKDASALRKKRWEMAVIKTIIREKELNEKS
ncbi:50S ribosomal protein L29 [Candidatus Shapirobacteria bacterium]|nr:50S ribosomal protein L29 [Candidatus Shapirobacteria bacterium]